MILLFGQRLKELRQERNLTQQQVASVFQTDRFSISRWEGGINEPDFETLIKFAKFYGVRSDYLLGLED